MALVIRFDFVTKLSIFFNDFFSVIMFYFKYSFCRTKNWGTVSIFVSTWDVHPNLLDLIFIGNDLDMMTSSSGNIFRVTGLLCGEFTGHRRISSQKASNADFDALFDLRLFKRLSKQSWGWWFETPSRPLWRHSKVYGNVLMGMIFHFGTVQTRHRSKPLMKS